MENNITDKKVNILKKVKPIIVHLSFSEDVNKHFEYMRFIIDKCYGKHSLYTFNNFPKADLYITEHFMSTKKYINAFPYKNKAINVIHSMNCFPKKDFIYNIALTNAWKDFLIKNGHNTGNIKVISGGVNIEPYKNIIPEQKRKIFGRITRWSKTKIPSWWNGIVNEILKTDKNINCLMYIEMRGKERRLMKHKRMTYDFTCKMDDFKGDRLKKLMVYVHANGVFKDIQSNAVLEAMATGLPIVYKKELSMCEVIGKYGIAVDNKKQLKQAVIELLNNKKLRDKYSKLSKERIKFYDVNKTIEEYDKLVKEVI